MNQKLSDIQDGFRKVRGTRDQTVNIHWITESRKTSTSASLTTLKPLTVWITTNCGKFLTRLEYWTMLSDSCKTCMQVKKAIVRYRHETTDWFQLGKGVCQGFIVSPCYLSYMQSTSCEMLGWMKHQLESGWPGEISITSDMQIKQPYGRKGRGTKKPLDAGLKVDIQKSNNMAFGPITSWQIDGETMEKVTNFIFLDFKFTTDSDCIHEIKGWDREGDGREVQKGGDICIPMADSC